FFTGLTGVLVFPLNAYLQSLRLDRTMMIQAMGIYLLLANAAVASVFGWQGAFPDTILSLAAIGVTAGLMGMAMGRRIRQRLSDQAFDRVFYITLGTIGTYIAVRAFVS
ncbi:MAG: sulfite exporter TauE/SafE family protein, partial [Gammaproteobacteria bacterium]